MNNTFDSRVGGILSADIAVPQQEKVVEFYAGVFKHRYTSALAQRPDEQSGNSGDRDWSANRRIRQPPADVMCNGGDSLIMNLTPFCRQGEKPVSSVKGDLAWRRSERLLTGSTRSMR